jgi:hypothetical protein
MSSDDKKESNSMYDTVDMDEDDIKRHQCFVENCKSKSKFRLNHQNSYAVRSCKDHLDNLKKMGPLTDIICIPDSIDDNITYTMNKSALAAEVDNLFPPLDPLDPTNPLIKLEEDFKKLNIKCMSDMLRKFASNKPKIPNSIIIYRGFKFDSIQWDSIKKIICKVVGGEFVINEFGTIISITIPNGPSIDFYGLTEIKSPKIGDPPDNPLDNIVPGVKLSDIKIIFPILIHYEQVSNPEYIKIINGCMEVNEIPTIGMND